MRNRLLQAFQLDPDIQKECQRLVDIAVEHRKTREKLEEEKFAIEKDIYQNRKVGAYNSRDTDYNEDSTRLRIQNIRKSRIEKWESAIEELDKAIQARIAMYENTLQLINSYLTDSLDWD